MNKFWGVILLLFCHAIYAQEEVQQSLEYLAEQQEVEEVDLTQSRDLLLFYKEHPLNLNQEDLAPLVDLGLLSELQAKALKEHIQKAGKLLSIYELQSVEHLSQEVIARVLPFVEVKQNFENRSLPLRDLFFYANKQLYLKSLGITQQKRGYSADTSVNGYLGTPRSYYLRARMHYGNLFSVGFTLEQDAGEQLTKSKLPDFSSAHFYVGKRGVLDALVLGDFTAQMGQGLTHFTGYASGKSMVLTSVKKNARALRPSTSVDESRFLRGVGVNFKHKDYAFMTFISRKSLSARLNATQDTALSILRSGYHRTESEFSTKGNLKESMLGASIQRKGEQLKLGVNAIYQRYNLPYFKVENVYNAFQFRGQEAFNTSIDYSWNYRNFEFFGESAYAWQQSAWAHLQGVLLALNQSLSMSVLHRNYDRAYHAFYAQAFAENSNLENEQGTFMALAYKRGRHQFNAYVDVFRFPWLKYQVDAPSAGQELNAMYQYNWGKHAFFYLRYRYRNKPKNVKDSPQKTNPVEDVIQENYRFQLQVEILKGLTWKMRWEGVQVKRGGEVITGNLLLQDLNYRPLSFPVDVSLRYALFDTDNYEARIYAYENNVLNVFSIPPYYDKGSRYYIVVRWRMNKSLDVNLRLASTHYSNKKELGSGLEQIKGSQKTEVTCQLRLKY